MKRIASFSALLAIVAITGCGSPRSLSVTPAARLAATTQQPAFTMTVQEPATVSAPPPCAGCIGEGYDATVSVPVVLTSTGYSGPVQLSIAGLPAAVAFVQGPIPPVTLVYGEPQTVNVNVYVLPGATPGSYEFTVSATNGPTMPVALTITSAASAAWRSR
jgi:predicted small lipoprotein YifL